MNRRGFFQRLGGAALGVTLARVMPGIAPRQPRLLFNCEAFRRVADGLIPMPDRLTLGDQHHDDDYAGGGRYNPR